MFVTIAIPTLNRASLLEGTLRSLHGQSGVNSPDCEVVVMDNGSTDGTRAVAERFRPKFRQFRHVVDATPGLHTGRNRAWQESAAEVMAFLDDDVLLSPTWLEGVRLAFQDPSVMLAGGPVLPKFAKEPPDWLLDLWGRDPSKDRILYELSLIDLGRERRRISPYHVFGCNFLIRRTVLEIAGGFHPDGMPKHLLRFRGDGETYVSGVVRGNGWDALYEPLAGLEHQVTAERVTVEYFCRRWYAQGISDSYSEARACPTLLQQARRKLAILKQVIGCHLRPASHGYRSRFRRSWLSGYASHQRWLLMDPALRSWVRRTHYLGTSGCAPSSRT